ncbi:MAG: hypothetical protein LBG46_04220 [Elusimicrobiota bacterium]|jgi:uncharacterized protein YfaS (alpha-2-macroglobulin family)|nr:hypothetical protein [Elusimicrobiota bacterium]
MKKIITLLSMLFAFGAAALSAQDLAKANKSFEEGLFKQAVTEYEPLLKSKDKNTRYEAQLKTALSYNYAYEYDNALKTIYSMPQPSNKLWKARYNIVKANIFMQAIGYHPAELEESKTNPTKFTQKQRQAVIDNAYKTLWNMRAGLVDMPTAESIRYLQRYYRPKNELVITPTLFDFMIESWTSAKTQPREVILQEAYSLGGKDRDAVREYWHIAMILTGLDNKNPTSKENIKIADMLSSVSGASEETFVNPLFFIAKEVIGQANAALNAAQIYKSAEEYEKSIDLLDYCLKLQLNYFTDSCKRLKDDITRGRLDIEGRVPFNVALNKPVTLKVRTSNIETVYMHIYKLTPEYFANSYNESFVKYLKNPLSFSSAERKRLENEISLEGWNIVPNWRARQNILDLQPARTLVLAFKYPKKYSPASTELEVPFMSNGLYAVVLSKNKKPSENDPMTILNFTNIAGYATSFTTTNKYNRLGKAFNIYPLDIKTGEIKQAVTVHAGNGRSAKNYIAPKTGALRIVEFENNRLSLLLQKDGNYSIIPHIDSSSSSEEKISIVLNTDRAIYRPGQEVKVKANVIERKFLNYIPYSGKSKLRLTLHNANWQEIASTQLALDYMGGADYTFILPQEGMLGNFTINAEMSTNRYVNSSLLISVEEYKRPEFEVNLKQFEGVASYDKPLNIEGNAVYYSGMPAAKAKVNYTISKTYFTPWFCWWWPPVQNRQEAIEGETKTDKDGNFKITFTPKEDKDLAKELRGRPAHYGVNVFVTDEGGRTIKTNRTYTVSGQEYFFAIKSDKGFLRAGTKNNGVQVKMVNADEKPLAGAAAAYVYGAKLKNPQGEQSAFYGKIIPPNNMPDLQEDKLITSMQVDFTDDGQAYNLVLPQLEEGYYVLKLIARDSKGSDNEGKFNFIVVNVKNPNIELPNAVTIAENPSYYAGENATILLGANKAYGPKFVEVYKDNFLVKTLALSNNAGPSILELPVLANYNGGFNINWFSVYNYQNYGGSLSLAVPTRNKKLDIKINAPAAVEPGAEVKADIEIKDEHGAPVSGQALISVYDKSLDYYREHSFNLPQVYPSKGYSNNSMENSFGSNELFGGLIMADVLNSPRLAVRSAGFGRAAMKSAVPAAVADGASNEGIQASTQSSAASPSDLRQNFAETAFWAPSLKITNGLYSFNFTVPQRISQWKVLAAAFTKDMKTGKTGIAFTTKKDLMIRIESPRFLRENDKINLKTIVANDTDKPMNAEITLTAKLDGENAEEILGLKETKQSALVPAKKQVALNWPLKAPQGSGVLSFAAVARAGAETDGELKTFPLLPSTQKLARGVTAALEKENTDISLEDISKDKSAKLEAVHLQIDPSLLMPVINAIPFITYGNYETSSGLINTYLPLAIMNGLYNKYPKIKEAVSKLPKRKTLTPQWQADENILIKDLASSPWYTLSKGYETNCKTIDIFNPALVKKTEKSVLDKLSKYQNKDGGFAWKQGGKSSVYITLLLLENMASARGFGVKIPESSVKNALKYIIKSVSVDTKNPSYENVSSALYMAYVLTSFPKDWHNYDVKNLMETASEYGNYMTPLGKANAALVYHRLGETQKAKQYLARLFDTAKEDPATGLYWAPEEYGWLWFNDTLSFHTKVIKALLEISPEDEKTAKLVKWLMFSKKAAMWGGSEAAAKAVYALLEVLQKNSALEGGKTFKVNWGQEEYSIETKPYDLSSKITLSKYGAQATKDFLKADIERGVSNAQQSNALPDFASLSALYTTSAPKQPSKGIMNINKEFYIVKDKTVKLLKNGSTVNVGDEIQVRLTINCKNRFDYVLIDDPKPAAFEADALLSGWRYDKLGRYEEIRDNKTNFFMDNLPNGAYELTYTLRPTAAGTYNVGAAQMQSMYSPEFAAHSTGFIIHVK